MNSILIRREHHDDVVVGTFLNPDEAIRALNEHPTVTALCEEDALDAVVVPFIPLDAS